MAVYSRRSIFNVKRSDLIMPEVKKRRILHIVEAMGGGVFTYLVDLVNELCDEYDVYIAYAVRPQTPLDFKDYFDKRIKMIEVKNFSRRINFCEDIKAFFEIKKIAEKIMPETIHLHSSKAGILGRLAFHSNKTALFYTPHGYSFLMQDSGKVKRAIYKGIETVVGGINPKCVTIACSKGEYEAGRKLTKKAAFVNNGIDIDSLGAVIETLEQNKKAGENQYDAKSKPLTIFTSGRICYQKNPAQFNAIAETFAKENSDIKFLWIGDGELRDTLTSKNIEITGWVDRNQVLEHSMRGDVFLLTSLWEGLPISLLEAMFMKKLCIVSNVIGNRDVIENEVNGFVCKNKTEFVRVIRNIGKWSFDSLIESAYDDILTVYNRKEMAKNYKKWYRKVHNDMKYKV